MIEIGLFSAFLMGLAGGVHCVGMCGGIASAFTFAIPKQASPSFYILAYNVGRVLSYSLAGALSGYLGAIASNAIHTTIPILTIISAVFLILLALYISDWYKGLSYFEKLGSHLWRYLQPLSKKMLPFKHPGYALGYGMVWGWLPCGLVYTALTWSMASGSALNGAAFMMMFGAGTFPALIAMSLGANFILPFLQHSLTRKTLAFGLIISAFVLILPIIQGIK
ncbi:sulfite exporter TauE/SafE family protein [Glaciecola siphonariae]|uniref:Sulfite exporter TauE/SafE family protein n=1 Tax=Glaciecola siphonariae TaxID=521012 RepID=A0ABV9LUV6_9ALTE